MTHAEGSPPPVGIVIVTYHSALHIGECLAAARRCAAQIVVVDNASQDGTRDEVLRMGVKLIANPTNRGFAAAVNQGIRALDTSYLLLLNPDAVIQKGIDALQACCAEPGVAAAGGKLVDAEGRPQVGFMVRRFPSPAALVFEALLINRLWPGNPVNRRYRCADLDFSVPQDVDQPAGAFLMFRREVWHKLGGLDERFSPLWFEDVDFCRRIRDAGYHIRYTPDAVAKHTGGHSLSGLTLEIRTLYWYGSFLRYTARHFRPWQRRLVSLAVLIGAFLRMIASAAMSRTLKSTAVYGEVISLAGRYFVSGRLQDE
ncbi:MAG TPA: glycosyltransferase family 2 protein [Bryobacteraceae bacterium]|nr:glycosyltransferase family 2 protein [Bryobacteraceae bacterium]